MKLFEFCFLFFLIAILIGCEENTFCSEKNIEFILTQLENKVSDDVKVEFKKCSESDITSFLTYDIELVIQEQLDLNNFVKHDLKRRGVSNNHIRSLLILLWHRQLNGESIDCERLVDKVVESYRQKPDSRGLPIEKK